MALNQDSCSCSSSCCGEINLVFPCSGGADVGELSDRIARSITKTGKAKMYCLAGIGGDVSGIVESAKSAAKILVIDGCPVECARKTLQKRGFENIIHIQLNNCGFKKGQTEICKENIEKVVKMTLELF